MEYAHATRSRGVSLSERIQFIWRAGTRPVLAGAKVLLCALFIGSLEAMDDIGMCVRVCVAPLGSKMIRKSANIHAAQHVYVIISVQFAFQ